MSPKLLPLLTLIVAFASCTIAEEIDNPKEETLITLDDLERVESIPENLSKLLNVLNSSQIYQVTPPIPSISDDVTNVSEDFVILPQFGLGETETKFPYFVRVTLLRIGQQDDDSSIKNDELITTTTTLAPRFITPEVRKPVAAIRQNDDIHFHSPSPSTPGDGKGEGLVVTGHVIHVLIVALYIFFGLGLALFILHNCVTCVSIWLWGRDLGVEQLPTSVRSPYRRRPSAGLSNSFFVNKQQFYEPL